MTKTGSAHIENTHREQKTFTCNLICFTSFLDTTSLSKLSSFFYKVFFSRFIFNVSIITLRVHSKLVLFTLHQHLFFLYEIFLFSTCVTLVLILIQLHFFCGSLPAKFRLKMPFSWNCKHFCFIQNRITVRIANFTHSSHFA